MKREDLLEAIGSVDESLLAESENLRFRRPGPMLWKVAAAAAVVAGLAVTAFAATKLLSRPVKDGGIVTGETIAPWHMDGGDIALEAVVGQKVTMDVEIDADAPSSLEEVYRIIPGEGWIGGYGDVDPYDFHADTEYKVWWEHTSEAGHLSFQQQVTTWYVNDAYGENVVDRLFDIPEDTVLKTEIVTVAGREMLKLTIPPLSPEGWVEDHLYSSVGEYRLYWTDGRYMMRLVYPSWMTDREVEKLLSTMYSQPHAEVYPEHWGELDLERLMTLEPALKLEAGKTGTTIANMSNTMGGALYADGLFFFSEDGAIRIYNSGTGECSLLETGEYSLPRNMFLTENFICYEDAILARHGHYFVSFDAEQTGFLFEGVSMEDLWPVGMRLYGINADRELLCMDLEKGQLETLAENVNRYYVDDKYIYVLPKGENAFLRSRIDEVTFERFDLSFRPVSLAVDGDELYFTEGGTVEEGRKRYQVVRYQGGEEIRLPVYTTRMQILDGKLLYEDDADSETVKSYDLVTGGIETVAENVFDFYIFEDRYVCFNYYSDGWGVLDWKTGGLTKLENYEEP